MGRDGVTLTAYSYTLISPGANEYIQDMSSAIQYMIYLLSIVFLCLMSLSYGEKCENDRVKSHFGGLFQEFWTFLFLFINQND